jgi:uroporphyrin-III C-methyltransferase
MTALAVLIATLALIATGLTYQQGRLELQRVELEASRRLADLATQLGRTQRELADTIARQRQNESRQTDFDAKLAEREGDRTAIADMYRELSRNVDERLLTEVEQILILGQQQLQLSGNVTGAIAALEAADQRLQRAEKLNASRLRRAIGQDLDRLRSLPAVDVAGLAIKLDTLATQVDTLPATLAQALPPETQSGDASKVSLAKPTPSATAPSSPRWEALWRDITAEWSQLIRIREAQPNEMQLLTPREIYLARQTLKLRILSARFHLLARDEANFKADLAAAQDLLSRYFDARQPLTIKAREQFRTLASSPITIATPDINTSLAELRAARLPRDRGAR